MYNSNIPSGRNLPSSQKLIKSTIYAVVTAAVLLITTVLPAEYGIDLTGIGRLTGLTDMGKIKVQLAEEAAAENNDQNRQRISEKQKKIETGRTVESSKKMTAVWKDRVSVTLEPGQGVEFKLVMDKGAKAWFEWTANGSKLNFDAHGNGNGRSVQYEKGRGVPNDAGSLEASFKGDHGWFWRNRTNKKVTLTLKTKGDYSKLKRTA